MTARDVAEWVLLAAAVVTAWIGLWKALARLQRNIGKRWADWFELAIVKAVKPMTDEVAILEHRTRELIPNGGESLVDKVSRIEAAQLFNNELSSQDRAELHRLVDEVTARVDVIEGR